MNETMPIPNLYEADYKHIKEWHQWVIYILALENDKLYCGITQWLEHRLYLHITGKGSKWTALHPPQRIIWTEVVPGGMERAKKLENAITLKLIAKYGKENVRGGFHCQIELPGKK